MPVRFPIHKKKKKKKTTFASDRLDRLPVPSVLSLMLISWHGSSMDKKLSSN